MFCGLRSRCSTFRSCACFSARQICVPGARGWRDGTRGERRRHEAQPPRARARGPSLSWPAVRQDARSRRQTALARGPRRVLSATVDT
eukprot:3223427-Prymnesium_polylepis.1